MNDKHKRYRCQASQCTRSQGPHGERLKGEGWPATGASSQAGLMDRDRFPGEASAPDTAGQTDRNATARMTRSSYRLVLWVRSLSTAQPAFCSGSYQAESQRHLCPCGRSARALARLRACTRVLAGHVAPAWALSHSESLRLQGEPCSFKRHT